MGRWAGRLEAEAGVGCDIAGCRYVAADIIYRMEIWSKESREKDEGMMSRGGQQMATKPFWRVRDRAPEYQIA